MSRSLSTIVFYGHTWDGDDVALIDQAESYTSVGKGNHLEWRYFGMLDYEGCGGALMVSASRVQTYGGQPLSLPNLLGTPAYWDTALAEYLETIGVTAPRQPQWWAVSYYG